jgi:hypothetical protein
MGSYLGTSLWKMALPLGDLCRVAMPPFLQGHELWSGPRVLLEGRGGSK